MITRDIISNNFKGINLRGSKEPFTKIQLIDKIDLWKYILCEQCKAIHGESILIGLQTLDLDYIAAIIASAELGLKIVIVDYNRKDDFTDLEYFDAKTKILSPIDIFLHDLQPEWFDKFPKAFAKFKFFSACAHRTYTTVNDLSFEITNKETFNTIKEIRPAPSDIVMRCTSSGTTGTPKIVEHTHQFLYEISKRNADKFSIGNCLHIRNLNHGSSVAVYLLPALLSDGITSHLFYDVDEDQPFDNFIDEIKKYNNTLSFVNFPYPFMIDEFIKTSLKKNIAWPSLNVQTLSYIQDSAKAAVSDQVFKSITSIFGSNETSGPVFECTITKDNTQQSSSCFTKVDDFYDISLDSEGLIYIGMPVYNNTIVTNDTFKLEDNLYKHSGRKDIVKVNGEIIDYAVINEFNNRFLDTYLVVDSVTNTVYIACWDTFNAHAYNEIATFFATNYTNVAINKTATLNKQQFLSGIKIDNELIREYFRNHV
tara:strand:- start:226 stop:1671 length:1446 start_codon:yes stop_codon:yes gene_type:complete